MFDEIDFRDEDHPSRWCSDCGRWIEEPCEHERDDDSTHYTQLPLLDLLQLKAPARFKLSKTIKLPSVDYAARQLDYWHDQKRAALRLRERIAKREVARWHTPLHDERTCDENIKAWQLNLDCAEWVRDYVAQHDCTPKVIEKRMIDHGITRFARVQVENDIYQVSVRCGRRAMGMYGKRGNKWHLSVYRQGTKGDLVGGEYCAKSEGLTSNAVREHLFRLWRLARGRRERSQDSRWRML
jgi:hypothetical protein